MADESREQPPKPHPNAIENRGEPVECGYCEEDIEEGDWMIEKEDALDGGYFFIHATCEVE